jgi:hypothetical protein
MFRSPRTGAGRALRNFTLAGVLGLGVSTVLPAAGADAVEPTRQTITQVGVHFTAAPCASGLVPLGLFDVTREITTYYDADGTPVRRLSRNRAQGFYWNPITGARVDAIVVREIHSDLITGESFSTGVFAHIWLPDGGGVAMGMAGLSVFDSAGQLVEHAGPDTATEQAQFCAALGAA